jgi:hypothetical protein
MSGANIPPLRCGLLWTLFCMETVVGSVKKSYNYAPKLEKTHIESGNWISSVGVSSFYLISSDPF